MTCVDFSQLSCFTYCALWVSLHAIAAWIARCLWICAVFRNFFRRFWVCVFYNHVPGTTKLAAVDTTAALPQFPTRLSPASAPAAAAAAAVCCCCWCCSRFLLCMFIKCAVFVVLIYDVRGFFSTLMYILHPLDLGFLCMP